ncbi:unnamed protein product [Eretmochelys imbricata]
MSTMEFPEKLKIQLPSAQKLHLCAGPGPPCTPVYTAAPHPGHARHPAPPAGKRRRKPQNLHKPIQSSRYVTKSPNQTLEIGWNLHQPPLGRNIATINRALQQNTSAKEMEN